MHAGESIVFLEKQLCNKCTTDVLPKRKHPIPDPKGLLTGARHALKVKKLEKSLFSTKVVTVMKDFLF